MSELRPEREHDELVGRFDAYASAAVPQFAAPPVAGLERAGRQRRRHRVATLGVAVGVTAVLVTAGLAGKGLLRGTPDTAAPGGRPSASGTPSTSALAKKDLGNAVVDLPQWPKDGGPTNRCPAAGPVRFAAGSTTVGGLEHRLSDSFLKIGVGRRDQPLTGRLAGLADEVRVVRIHCAQPGKPAPIGVALLALTEKPDGGLRGLGYLATEPTDQLGSGVGFADGTLVVDLQRQVAGIPYAQRRTFGWNGTALAQVSGPTAFPARLTLADVDPRNWVYDISGSEQGGDMIACLPWNTAPVRDGVGSIPGVGVGVEASACSGGTARLLIETRGTVRGAGPVRFVTVAVEIDGRPPVVAVYAMYDRRGSLVVQLLDNRRVESVQPPGVQRVSGDRLELSLKTLQGEQTFQWQWTTTPSVGQPAHAFVPAP
jgi:hypothetical protein